MLMPGMLETVAKLLDRGLEPDVDRAPLKTRIEYQGDDCRDYIERIRGARGAPP